MSKTRLEAFSDGVIAIIITIMVLELPAPHSADLAALRPLLPKFLSYVLSFVFLGIYWNNHHHLLQAVERVNGRVLWANLHLLFWLTLVPFVTSWIGGNPFAELSIAIYGVVMWMAGFAYYLLTLTLISLHGPDSKLATALGDKPKEIASLTLYTAAIALSFLNTSISLAIYVLVALIWIVPDMRIEKTLT